MYVLATPWHDKEADEYVKKDKTYRLHGKPLLVGRRPGARLEAETAKRVDGVADDFGAQVVVAEKEWQLELSVDAL